MKIGLLQCGEIPEELQETHGDYEFLYASMLAGQDFTFETYYVFEGNLPETPDQAAGWLISGSSAGVYEDHEWIAPVEGFVRRAVEGAHPVVGICFGHQLIAQALGGTVQKSDTGWTIGRQVYDFGGVDLPLNAWHQDRVVKAPEGAITLATGPNGPFGALLYGDRALSFQPHPEFGPEFIEAMCQLRAPGVVPQELADAALRSLDEPLANEIIADQIADFFRRPRGA